MTHLRTFYGEQLATHLSALTKHSSQVSQLPMSTRRKAYTLGGREGGLQTKLSYRQHITLNRTYKTQIETCEHV